MSCVRASGSSLYCSEILVKPLMSENKKVISFLSPPSTNASLDSARRLTISGDKYCAKAPLTRLRSSSVNKKLKKVMAIYAINEMIKGEIGSTKNSFDLKK